MRDLRDGETVEMQGSAKRPYVLKNVSGLYSCSCPAWRFQSLPIDQRTCRHIRSLRGDTAEQTRVGLAPLSEPMPVKKPIQPPPLLLAESWNEEVDPSGYWMSEKLDGVRAFWTGTQFLSRQGNRYFPPPWFTLGLPLEPLDGELWIGRKQFQKTVSVVRRQDGADLWKEVRFRVFDAPADESPFESRLHLIDTIMEINRPAYACAHEHVACSGRNHLRQELARMQSVGGEGLMLRQPGSRYEAGRSRSLLKVKQFFDAEACVIGYEPGTGRHKGRLGALLVEMANGIRFAIGTGLSDRERDRPPVIGTTVMFRYQELSDAGVPRFASFIGVREDIESTNLFPKGETQMATIATNRRFEFVGGGSDKFWEVAVNNNEVVVRFGRNGTSGQVETKTFADATTATKHADKKISEKIKKGYVEVR